jgi:ABC-type antimicrobial peptide transport system permease subunit
VAGAVILAVGCGMLFGILPARRAASLDPVAALARR